MSNPNISTASGPNLRIPKMMDTFVILVMAFSACVMSSYLILAIMIRALCRDPMIPVEIKKSLPGIPADTVTLTVCILIMSVAGIIAFSYMSLFRSDAERRHNRG